MTISPLWEGPQNRWNSSCAHGMPSRASCVDCMFENGLGATQPRQGHGIYKMCLDLVRQGIEDRDVPAKIKRKLSDSQREALINVGLMTYAAQARRQVNAEQRYQTIRDPRTNPALLKSAVKRKLGITGYFHSTAERVAMQAR